MRVMLTMCAALGVAMVPAVAHADDPHDPAMRSAAARAHDRDVVRQLNRDELARTQARDARYAQGWSDWRDGRGEQGSRSEYAEADRSQADYARERARYERDMASWRRAVAACRDGDYSACDN
ncbi:hypothetical protein [Novosphingobium lentum]|uniref:hypothetical protein n=1 Tax=Novosphingobium lentum TaxID=145287 RepID=UPI00082A04BE|nr:hypothetical protein [Novosphingobium lentum]